MAPGAAQPSGKRQETPALVPVLSAGDANLSAKGTKSLPAESEAAQRSRLLGSTTRLTATQDRLEESRRMLAETEVVVGFALPCALHCAQNVCHL